MDKKELFDGFKQLDVTEKAAFFVQGLAETTVSMFAGLLGAAVDVSNDVIDINSKNGVEAFNKRLENNDKNG